MQPRLGVEDSPIQSHGDINCMSLFIDLVGVLGYYDHSFNLDKEKR